MVSWVDNGVCLYEYEIGNIFFYRFGVVGYGCMTCIGNSGPLSEPVAGAIEKVSWAPLDQTEFYVLLAGNSLRKL